MSEVAAEPIHGSSEVSWGVPTRIVLVDDHLLFAEAMAFALSRAGFDVVGTAGSGEEAVRLAGLTRPDLVLLDLRLPDGQGLDVGVRIMRKVRGVRVIAMSAFEDATTIRSLRRAGFHGFLPKTTRVVHLVAALGSTDPEGVWFLGGTPPVPRGEGSAARGGLTRREAQVLDLLVEGYPAAMIASKLGIATSTARSHVQNILAKLQVHTRLEAVAVAMGGSA